MQVYLFYAVAFVVGAILASIVTFFILKNNPALLVRVVQKIKVAAENKLSQIDAQMKAGVSSVVKKVETEVSKTASNVAAAYASQPAPLTSGAPVPNKSSIAPSPPSTSVS
jgi:hypothetical protein